MYLIIKEKPPINKAIGGYENIRNKVIEGDQDIQTLKHRLKKV